MPIDNEQKVVVVGLGYIGLPTAAIIARAGAHVLGQLLHDLRTEFEVPEVAAVGFAGGLRAQPDRSGAMTFLREKRPLLMMMYLREL